MQNKLISIGITCFNAQETIARAIESALAQSWPNTEIIVTDDASSDGSREIIESYARLHTNIHLIQNKENAGVSSNRQKILDAAKGNYLVYFDDDDWSYPDRVEKQYNRLKEYASIIGHEKIFCYGDRILIKPNEDEKILHGIGRAPKEPHGLIVADMILGNKMAGGYSWGLTGSGTMLAPVQLMRDLGGFDPAFRRSAEIDLALRASKKDVHFVSVDTPVIKQYHTATTDKSPFVMGKYTLMMIFKHFDLVIKRGLVLRIFYPYVRYARKKLGLQSK